MSRQTDVAFSGSTGQPLSGVLHQPKVDTGAYALIAHCFTGGKQHAATSRISRALTDRGMAVLRFDFTGLGESAGDFAESTFSSNVQDLVLAADYMRQHYAAPSLLIGHSLGGAAALAAAGRIPEVDAVATVAAPFDPAHVVHLFSDALDDIEAAGEAHVTLAGRRFQVRQDFLDDLNGQDQTARIADLGRPLLVLHAPRDEIVAIDNAGKIYASAKHPKSFICLDGADHLLTDRRQAERVALLIAAWADPYLPEPFDPDID